jgi:hypothetical protein
MPTPRRLPVGSAVRCPAAAAAVHFRAAEAFPVAAALVVVVGQAENAASVRVAAGLAAARDLSARLALFPLAADVSRKDCAGTKF